MCLSAEEANEFMQVDIDVILKNTANGGNMLEFMSPELLLQCFLEYNESHPQEAD
eukprot:TRINITY_DN3329_c5_g1_i2.p5 TRINITY_DN3329_c5_g1~~TRINITY_DN3329_c5_g1_i2.p5  ORF type:complete len:55 (-),score=14.09 TRINITY_DN3329_c5_g1_i2:552-716(-)